MTAAEFKKKNGYTMIELLMVVLIMTLFAVVVTISVSGAYNRNVLKNNAYLLISKLNYYKVYSLNNNIDTDVYFYADRVTFQENGAEVDKVAFTRDCTLDFPVASLKIDKKGFIGAPGDFTFRLEYKNLRKELLIGKYVLKVR